MNIYIVILESVLVLLGIGTIGFLIARRGIIPENVLGILTRLAVDIALPSLIFASILVNFNPDELPGWWQLPLWWVFFTIVSLVLSLITSLVSAKATRGEFIINLLYQNGLFFPLIIITGIFGQDTPYLPQLYLFTILHPIMFFSTYQLFFKKKTSVPIQWSRIFNPIFFAVILAIIAQLAGVSEYLPTFIRSILEILGGMALPLIFLILGGSLYLDLHQGGKFFYKEIAKFLIVKNVIFPLVFLALLIFWRPPYGLALIFLLEAAVPPVSATPILTERAGGNKSISNQFVFTSFIFSIVSIPLIFQLFTRFFPIP